MDMGIVPGDTQGSSSAASYALTVWCWATWMECYIIFLDGKGLDHASVLYFPNVLCKMSWWECLFLAEVFNKTEHHYWVLVMATTKDSSCTRLNSKSSFSLNTIIQFSQKNLGTIIVQLMWLYGLNRSLVWPCFSWLTGVSANHSQMWWCYLQASP